MKPKAEQPADVIDITPLRCSGCGTEVGVDDAYCESCGASLLDEEVGLWANCGHILHAGSSFCAGCGTKLAAPREASAVETETAPLLRAPITLDDAASDEEEDGAEEPHGPFWRRRSVIGILATLIVAIVAFAAWLLFLRPPDLTSFDAGVKAALATAQQVEEQLDDLSDPADLPGFAVAMTRARQDLNTTERSAARVTDETHRGALEGMIVAEQSLFDEFVRLGELPSADVDESEFTSLPGLITDFNDALGDLNTLRLVEGAPRTVEFSDAILRRTLFDLAAYRERVIDQRARIMKQNRQRAQSLATVTAFVGDLDGIIQRYSDSRQELSNWITETNAGSTWMEAYQVLDQQQQRRSQLRSELAALDAPSEFVGTKTALLGIMDRAIDAMGAAYRGMAEFQYSWDYWDFRETPGWIEFERATATITTDLASTLSTYESTKSDVVKRLSKKKDLPELPD